MAVPSLLSLILLPALVQDTVVSRVEFDERFPIELTGEVTDDQEGSALMEALDWIRLHPYDLNSITMDELLSIPCVPFSGARSVLAYREGGGRFQSPAQLLTIEGGGAMLYQALVPFVCVDGSSPPGSGGPRVSFRGRAIRDMPGDPSALGSPLRVFSRLVFEGYRGLEAGGLFAKGAGERAEDGSISGYAVLRGLGCVTDLMAGDYELESGQGLVLWRGPTAVRSIWSLRPGEGLAIVPHRSSDETRFLRGAAIAATVKGGLRCALFLSDRRYGASVDTGGEATGFFRGEYSTAGSAAKKDALRERLVGFRGEYACSGVFAAGCTLYRSFFDRSFLPADRMRLAGNRVEAWGIDVSGRLNSLSTSAECAFLNRGAHAFVWSMTLAGAGGRILMIRWRDYQPGYDNPHASGEGANGETRNERGFSAALRLVSTSRSGLECYVDAFEHPWPDARTPIPRKGIELTVSARTGVSSGGTFSVRFSRKSSYDQLTAEDTWGREVRIAGRTQEDHLRFEVSSRAKNRLQFSSVLECAGISTAGGDFLHGTLLGGEISFAPVPFFSLDTRFSLFRTDGYAARLYEYESGLPGLLSLPPLYGQGLRWYLRFRWSPAQWSDVTVRYSATVKEPSVSPTEPFLEMQASRAAQFGLQTDIRLP